MINKFKKLRAEYPQFNFEKYEIKKIDSILNIIYYFNISNKIFFTPTLQLDLSNTKEDIDITDDMFRNIVFHIGLIELISYWKCTCSPIINLNAGLLLDEQKEWWLNLYYYGLGEFLYINNINVELIEFVKIINKNNNYCIPSKKNLYTKGNLIPIGGGKDSAVTLELLSNYKDINHCFILNPRKASKYTASIGNYTIDRIITLNRKIDSKLIKLNNKGFLNGHTPFSALLGFITLLVAFIFNKKYIVLSNEYSANEGNIYNTKINHQYSKTFEFELNFSNYIKKYFTNDIHYFSLLRPLNELQIAKLFSNNKQYFKYFKSCNVGSKEDIWCGNCPKCLFVYIILSPFLNENELLGIFGKNLLDNKMLEITFEKLVNTNEEKPFECVGTRQEINAALGYTIEKLKNDNQNLPYLLNKYEKGYKNIGYNFENYKKLINYYNKNNLLPQEFKKIITESLPLK